MDERKKKKMKKKKKKNNNNKEVVQWLQERVNIRQCARGGSGLLPLQQARQQQDGCSAIDHGLRRHGL
jgi:hypothetical protein